MYNGVHVGARGGTLCAVFHTKQLVFTTLDKVCQPCETSMDDGVNPFRLCWAGRHQQRLIVQPHTVHCLSSFLSTGGIHEMFFCVANMTEWYRMFVKQVMWVPSTSSTSFQKLLRPLFSSSSLSSPLTVPQRYDVWVKMADFMDDMAVSHTGVRNQWFFATLRWAECEIFFRWTSAKKGYYGWSSKSETNSQGACGFLAQVEIPVFVIFLGSILDTVFVD